MIPRLVAAAALTCLCAGQEFALREIDMHLHAGMERPVALHQWVDLAVKDGRRVLLLLDHLELYRHTPKQHETWLAGRRFDGRYAMGAAGHKALFDDFNRAARRRDVTIFKGWEISEDELDTGVEEAPMRMADAIGWHISPKNGGEPPNGATLIRRAKQILEIQKKFPVPMILFHPFPMRIENIQRTAKRDGRDVRTIPSSEYRFFRDGEQEELIALLKGRSIYIEISSATEQYFDDPACREALIAETLPLAKAGVQFSVSTDNHNMRAASKPFHPERYCTPMGVSPQNSNRIVRELFGRLQNRTR